MKELNFANDVKEACKLFECIYYKIPDSNMALRFIPPKPYDAFIVKNGKYIAIEFKMHKLTSAFPFGSVKDHQIEGLLDTVKRGKAKAIVMLNIRMKGVNETYWYHVSEYVAQKHKYAESHNRKSIPLEELRKTWHFVSRGIRNEKNKICLDLAEPISSLCSTTHE